MSDDSRHYEIKNELSSMNGKLGSIESKVYDIERNVDLLTEWAVAAGIALAAIALCAVIGMFAVFAIMARM